MRSWMHLAIWLQEIAFPCIHCLLIWILQGLTVRSTVYLGEAENTFNWPIRNVHLEKYRFALLSKLVPRVPAVLPATAAFLASTWSLFRYWRATDLQPCVLAYVTREIRQSSDTSSKKKVTQCLSSINLGTFLPVYRRDVFFLFAVSCFE